VSCYCRERVANRARYNISVRHIQNMGPLERKITEWALGVWIVVLLACLAAGIVFAVYALVKAVAA
jgi:hypothetical protein